VAVRWLPDALELTVTDDRPNGGADDAAALLAVRERVAVYDGDLTVTTTAAAPCASASPCTLRVPTRPPPWPPKDIQ